MSQKTKKQAEEKGKKDFKTFNTTEEEKTKFKQVMSTIGFLEVLFKGLDLSLEYEQRRVERRVNIGKAKEGFTLQTMIDPVSLNLLVREVKIPEATPGKEESVKK